MRRYANPPLQGQKYIHRPGAYGIFTHPRGILLTVQNLPKREGIEWQLPGGGIEKGEHPIPALVREAYEETGWRVQVERKLGAWKRFTYMPEYEIFAEKICHIYLGRAVVKLGDPLEADHYASFVSAEDAKALLANEADREILRRWC